MALKTEKANPHTKQNKNDKEELMEGIVIIAVFYTSYVFLFTSKRSVSGVIGTRTKQLWTLISHV